jgi:hypothetical protein
MEKQVLHILCDGAFDFIPPVGDRPLLWREGPLLKHMSTGRRTNHHVRSQDRDIAVAGFIVFFFFFLWFKC